MTAASFWLHVVRVFVYITLRRLSDGELKCPLQPMACVSSWMSVDLTSPGVFCADVDGDPRPDEARRVV